MAAMTRLFLEKLMRLMSCPPATRARELATKARAAGVSANGVPVFDVGGKVFSGFQPEVLLAAIRGGPT